MNKLMPYLVKILFFIFVLAVGVGIISMSFNALGRIFPDDLFDQAIGLVLFDIAAFTWFLVLAYNSESTMQYVFAALGFLTGLFGTFGLIGIEVGISSGMLVATEMTRPLTYVFIAVFAGHLSLIYAFHSSAPHMNAKISLGIDKAKIVDEGQRQAEKELAKQMPQLGATIAARLVSEVMKDLNLTPARGHVLDLPALPVENVKDFPAPAVAMNGASFIKDWILNRAPKKHKYEQAVAKVEPQKKAVVPGADDMRVRSVDPNVREDSPKRGEEVMFYNQAGKLTLGKRDESGKIEVIPWPDEAKEKAPALKMGYDDKASGGEKSADDVIRAGECECPSAFFDLDKFPSNELREMVNDRGGVRCWNPFTGMQELNASAAATCAKCGFFKKAGGTQ